MAYVIICGPAIAPPANADAYQYTNNIDELRNLACIDRLTLINVNIITFVEAVQKPFCDDGTFCNGGIYQVT